MFRNLANYLLGTTGITTTTTTTTEQLVADGVEDNIRLNTNSFDEDWVLVDRDSEGNSDVESLESLDDDDEEYVNQKKQNREEHATLTRTSSTSSIPRAIMEESWFLTPPPCFTSAGPVHMETSPLENLLIEHPSMSVYNSQQVFIARRPNNLTTNLTQQQQPQQQINAVTIIDDNDDIIVLENDEDGVIEAAIRVEQPRRNRVETLRQQERQCLKSKQAQKVIIINHLF